MSTTVRISRRGGEILSQLSQEAGQPMTMVLESALEAYRRQQFLAKAASSYAQLSEVDRAAYYQEIASIDGTLHDGLDHLSS